MNEWIKWIGNIAGAILGTGLIGQVVMYFIKRHDERIEKEKSIIEKVISGLSQYGERLNTAFRIWDANITTLINEIEDYVKIIHETGDNLEFLDREYKETVEEESKYICKYAEICPRCIKSENFAALREYCEKSKI